ncbi:hypothetical protein Vqi01_02190 [Micromonospora qiuiae]|uniref:Uncharacterized protein n=1 Tax=Micromonospora qiuiae TaxID=502268 RepID=A0ABQ4J4G2_9ACTN|nr:hypothetical protein [Micromonospora qiuiae]GIJ25057.1 hypothetical protein Vqi01_02190 [Micromonospora qiuiae]
MTNYSTGQVARSSLAITKVRTEGKIRIRNNSGPRLGPRHPGGGAPAPPRPTLPTTPAILHFSSP